MKWSCIAFFKVQIVFCYCCSLVQHSRGCVEFDLSSIHWADPVSAILKYFHFFLVFRFSVESSLNHLVQYYSERLELSGMIGYWLFTPLVWTSWTISFKIWASKPTVLTGAWKKKEKYDIIKVRVYLKHENNHMPEYEQRDSSNSIVQVGS